MMLVLVGLIKSYLHICDFKVNNLLNMQKRDNSKQKGRKTHLISNKCHM